MSAHETDQFTRRPEPSGGGMTNLRGVLRSCLGQFYVRDQASFRLTEVGEDCFSLERSTDGSVFVIAISAISYIEIKNGQLQSIDYISRRWG